MKQIKFLLIALIIIISCDNSTLKKEIPKLNVSISKNVEVVGLIYCLTDNGQYMLNEIPEFGFQKGIAEKFIKYSKHPAIKTTLTLNRNGNSFWLDAIITLAHNSNQFPEGKLKYKLPENTLLRANKNIEKADSIIEKYILQINDFYKVADLDSYFTKHRLMYDSICMEVQNSLPKEDIITEMEQFYRKRNKSYTLCPSAILFTGFGFATYIQSDEGLEVYNTFGSLEGPKTKNLANGNIIWSYGFENTKEIRNLTIHEFGHSFVNTITEKPHNLSKINKINYLINPIKLSMSKQGYGKWIYCFNEHLVHLGEIRIAERLGDTIESGNLKNEYVNELNFIYIPHLLNLIKVFEKDSINYKTFEDFLPNILSTLNDIDTNLININY